MNPEDNNVPAIDVDNLTVSYGGRPALESASFAIDPGLMVGVIGPNGAGKSTLIKALVGFVRPDSGDIQICGVPARSAKGSIAYVPQRGDLDWDFPVTVEDVVMMARYARLPWWRSPDGSDKSAVRAAMDTLGIGNLHGRPIGELSGGQKQRVFLARALAQNAEVFLLDEPFAGLDAATEKELVKVLARVRAEGRTLLVVHHDLATAGDYFDRIILLNQKLFGYDTPHRMLRPDILRRVYEHKLEPFKHPIWEAAAS
ncbi:MAG: metal ABC transporter ATP-binding protein [Desulfomonilaceae bacterium]